ncbi:MAG: dTDP-4-dehydrorhamnose reductase [Pseudonocardiales bacterium]|nr:dTDP-4-dehydrorhamnose reductase [Pseudonocardiales bacterium]PZS29787.1 MAG: dTDP-4-dehydrorhamnose reductase [Pseudonocardiales bacterium]
MNLSLLVTGGGGQLGRDVAAAAVRAGITRVRAAGSAELDITDPAAVSSAMSLAGRGSRLVVINAAAYTAVDAAEREGAARAHAVNAQGPANLALACAAHHAHLVQVSTDYVFAGDSAGPNQVDGRTAPRTVYGRTKLAGERAVLSSGAFAHVVRTAWLYGAHGGNFVRTMARMARGGDPVRVVDDQHGNPTWTADLADGLIALALAADRVPTGVLHCANAGITTWFGLARAVFAEAGADPDRVRPCSTADYPRPAPRPANSVLDTAGWVAAGLPELRHWRAALHAAVAAGALAS